MKAQRYTHRRFWAGQKPMENGRSPLPGIDIYLTTVDGLTLDEFLYAWKRAYEEIKATVIADVEKENPHDPGTRRSTGP